MNIQHTVAIALLAVMGSTAAMAQTTSDSAPLTRAEVRQSVIAARAAGELLPFGESDDYPRPQIAAPSALTRSTVRAEVLEARAHGDLLPAGDNEDTFVARTANSADSVLTRADVRKATLQARDAGELIPAGEEDASDVARARAQEQYARAAHLARQSFGSVIASRN